MLDARNYFFVVTKQREGDAGWGMTTRSFDITPMPVGRPKGLWGSVSLRDLGPMPFSSLPESFDTDP